MRIQPDITISTLRRDINFINSIHDGSIKIGEIHFSKANYRDFNNTKTFRFIRKTIAYFWMNQLTKELKKLTKFVVLSQEDKYIVDVLRKLPGIKIAENSTISYQGEAINKFYIEGRDLLGGQYNLATNNLDVNAVTAVEVLENNQHIKALKGIEFSEKTAINLKLKKGYTIRPFGEVQLGIGGDPVLYDEKIFAAYLGGKIQTMANLKVNNTGDYILDEMENKLDIGSLFSFEPLAPNFINPPTPLNVPLNSKRHLFNNNVSSG